MFDQISKQEIFAMFRNMKVGARLTLGFAIVIVLMIGIIAVALRQGEVAHEKLERIVKINNVRINLANCMLNDVRKVSIALHNTLLLKNIEEARRMRDIIAEERKNFDSEFNKLQELTGKDDTKATELISKVKASTDDSRPLNNKVFDLAVAGKDNDAFDLMTKQGSPSVDQWIVAIEALVHHNEELSALRYDQAEKARAAARSTMFILGAAAIALSVLIVIFLTLGITRPLSQSVDAANRIASGDQTIDLSDAEKRGDELGLMLQSFSKMIATLRDAANQADVISKGDYSVDIAPLSDKDVLGIALQRMTRALRENRDHVQRQDWLKTGIARLNQVVSGDPDLATLASKVISEIATYLDAQVGAIYVARNGIGAALSLMGSYAYTKRKNLSNVFKPGEGLVGQAALEKKQILIRNVPEDYIRVTSGLGESIPRFICVSPLIYEDRVKGVIEVGTLSEITDQQMEYLNQAMPALALAIESAESRTKLAKSLEESQALTEELRTTNVELEEQTQALKISEEELKAQQEELQVTNEELEEKNELLDRQKRDVEKARKDIEEQAEELALASKYKSEFLANMSHELRTPLNSLLLLAQSLSENKGGNLNGEQVESAKIIHGSGNDLLNLINEILDLSKIESGRMDLQLGRVLISDLAEGVRASFGHMTEKKGIKLEVAVPEDAMAEIKSDRKRIEQVIRNLVSNAIKFTDSGSVTVTFARPSPDTNLSRSGLSADECLAVEVRDTGIGIAPENQKIIFEAFQQVDGGTSRKYTGTGLGLSVSRELARIMGGEIQVYSELGKGSTFTLYLPVVVSPGRKVAPGSATVTVARADEGALRDATRQSATAVQIEDDRDKLEKDNRVILVIDDDPNFARLLHRKCHEKGFKCLAAPTGEAGLELATKHQPAAIILDIHLPGMDGWAVLSALKEDVLTRHIPVHIVSVEEVSTEALRKGAVGHASKPLSQEVLEETFRKLEQVSAGKPKRVLVVDDDPNIRRATVKLIGDEDVKVDEAETGKQAQEALRSGGYDCVVLDLGLPDISGAKLLEKLEREGVDLPPVIVHTARDLTLDEEMDLRDHSEAIVIKDVRSQERLLDEVSLFLHRVVSKMPEKKRQIIMDLHDSDALVKDKKVLIVDDDMRTTFAVSHLLAERGMKTLKAENGERALMLLEEHPDVDLVLMDIMMPVMDGYEAMKRIREQERFRSLPIIVLTAKAMREDREKSLAAGANDYLPKPVDQKRLLSMIRVWLCR
ncbi:MAG: response regulator [Pseudomonadota bacterium]